MSELSNVLAFVKVPLRHLAVVVLKRSYKLNEVGLRGDDIQSLGVVIEKHGAEVEVLVFIPLLEERVDRDASRPRGRVTRNRSDRVGRAEDPLHAGEIFEPCSTSDIRMVLRLANIVVRVSMESVNTQPTFELLKKRGQRAAHDDRPEITADVVTTAGSPADHAKNLRNDRQRVFSTARS